MIPEVYSEKYIYSQNYYASVLSYVGDMSIFNSSDPSSQMENYLHIMNSIINTGRNLGSDYDAKASFFDLLLYPIRNKFNLVGSNYSTFNINIEFFNSIKEINKKSISTQEVGHMYSLASYSFKEQLLTSFVLKNIDTGICYTYTNTYDVYSMTFADGVEVEIDIDTPEIKKSNK
jgi:hypothetical protein